MVQKPAKSQERQAVLDLLARWYQAITRMDQGINKVKTAVTTEAASLSPEFDEVLKLGLSRETLGSLSPAVEEARLAALRMLDQVRSQTSDPHFWPILSDRKGGMIMLELQKKLEEAYVHQLKLLRVWGIMTDAVRRGRVDQVPDLATMEKARRHVLDEMGRICWKLAQHYGASPQEVQAALSIGPDPGDTGRDDSTKGAASGIDKVSLENLQSKLVTWTLQGHFFIQGTWTAIAGVKPSYQVDVGICSELLDFLLYVVNACSCDVFGPQATADIRAYIVPRALQALFDARFAALTAEQGADSKTFKAPFVMALLERYNDAEKEYNQCAEIGIEHGEAPGEGTVLTKLAARIVRLDEFSNPDHNAALAAKVLAIAQACLVEFAANGQLKSIWRT